MAAKNLNKWGKIKAKTKHVNRNVKEIVAKNANLKNCNKNLKMGI